MKFFKSKYTIFLMATLLLMWSLSASVAVTQEIALTEEEEAFLNCMDYNAVEDIARHMTVDIGNRRTTSFRIDETVEYLAGELRSYGYAPQILEYDATDAVYSRAASANNKQNIGYVEIGGKKYIYFGPSFGATSVYSFANKTVSLAARGSETLTWENTGAALPITGSPDYGGRAVFVKLGVAPTMNAVAAAAPNATNYYNAALALQAAGAGAVIFQNREPRTSFISPLPPYNNVSGDQSTYTFGDTTYSTIGNTTSGEQITIPVGTVLWTEMNNVIGNLSENMQVAVNMRTSSTVRCVKAVLPSATGSVKSVYISAHIDCVSNGAGFNDNAGGASMLMGMARAWKRAVDAGELAFEHNIVFLLFDSEEWATMAGSSGYVDAMSDEEQENFLGIYNMDMIATNQPETIHLFLCISSPLIDGLQRNMELLPWDESDDLSKYTDEQVRLILKPEALKIMDEFSTFGNSMIAIKKLDENGRHKKRVNIVDPKHPDFGKDLNLEKYTGLTHGSGTDNVRFMHAVYGSLNNSRPTGYTGEWPPAANFVYEWPGGRKFNPNLRNSLQYTWRKHRRGLSPTMSVGVMLEELYHKAGDNMEINYSRDRLEIMGDVISLAVYLSAEGSVELGGGGDDDDNICDLGCNVGYALIILLAVLAPFFIKKSK